MTEIPAHDLEAACGAIRDAAEANGVSLRPVGSFAVRSHCGRFQSLLDRMGRDAVNDLDFAAERRHSKSVRRVFEGLGYVGHKQLALATDGQHQYFVHPQTRLGVDVYFDLLNYCHPIPFADRLRADPVTIPLAELLLAKMQIVELTEKDVKDTVVLLVEHDLGTGDDETINADRVADLLSRDWGFYYTFTQNVGRVVERLDRYDALDDAARATVRTRLGGLQERIEAHPKDFRWKLRSRVGTKRQWYQDVEEKE